MKHLVTLHSESETSQREDGRREELLALLSPWLEPSTGIQADSLPWKPSRLLPGVLRLRLQLSANDNQPLNNKSHSRSIGSPEEPPSKRHNGGGSRGLLKLATWRRASMMTRWCEQAQTSSPSSAGTPYRQLEALQGLVLPDNEHRNRAGREAGPGLT